MRKVTTKKGDSWDKLLLALGSSKPWVSRSLRPWIVWVSDDRITFCFGSGCNEIGRDRLYPLIRLIDSGGCTGTKRILFGTGIARLTEVEFFDPEDSDFDFSIPTKLVIEAVRIIRRGGIVETDWMHGGTCLTFSSRGSLRTKEKRRRWLRYKIYKRRKFVKGQGTHLRWMRTGILARVRKQSIGSVCIFTEGSY